jgi:two-component system, sensor histidine kinase and response regulator
MSFSNNRRILLIDDSPSIHQDFEKIFLSVGNTGQEEALVEAKAAFFGGDAPGADEAATPASQAVRGCFELTSAYQGQEGLEFVKESIVKDERFAMAFVDMRMPPGWDGIKTIAELWKVDPDLEIVVCTAYSDYSWSETINQLGQSDQLLILKKPFDPIEIEQLANALTRKWNAARSEQSMIVDLRKAEGEARAYAASLETSNRALQSAVASADKTAELKSRFLAELSLLVSQNLSGLVDGLSSNDLPSNIESSLDTSRDLMRTLNLVLDLQTLESGGLEFVSAPTSPTEVLEAAVARHVEAAERKGLAIICEFPMSLPPSMEIDSERFGQALDALLDYAVHASVTGTIRLRGIFVAGNDYQNGKLRAEILHPGSAPTREEAANFFEPFAQGTDGIGLAFCRGLAHAMGGRVRASATEDGTACLTLETTVRLD